VEISSSQCPTCGGMRLTRIPDLRLARIALDLHISPSGIKRWVTRFTTTRHRCATCGNRFLPREYLRLEEHFHSLKSSAMYEHVAHRKSLAGIAATLRDCFRLPVYTPAVHRFKGLLARYYGETYQRLMEKIIAGALIHADETEVRLKRTGKGYIWVFSNMEEV